MKTTKRAKFFNGRLEVSFSVPVSNSVRKLLAARSKELMQRPDHDDETDELIEGAIKDQLADLPSNLGQFDDAIASWLDLESVLFLLDKFQGYKEGRELYRELLLNCESTQSAEAELLDRPLPCRLISAAVAAAKRFDGPRCEALIAKIAVRNHWSPQV